MGINLAFFDIFINFKRINVWILMKEIRCIQVADIYEWVQFDADPRSGDLNLWKSSYWWFKI